MPSDVVHLALYAALEIAVLWALWWLIGLWHPAYRRQFRRRIVLLSLAVVALYVFVGYQSMHG